MPLSDNAKFGVKALTEAVNNLPVSPTPIRSLGLFAPQFLSTTHVDVENQDGVLRLVQSKERGTSGQDVPERSRSIRTFKVPHLPVDDVVRADDVQNLRAFGSSQAATVEGKVLDKMADGKNAIEWTREHMQLGALLGKILDADGTEIYDIYKEFKLERTQFALSLDKQDTKVGLKFDQLKTALRKQQNGEMVGGWIALCSPEFMQALVHHDTMIRLYERYQDGATYREQDTSVQFEHKGIKFIQYDNDFGTSAAKIDAGSAILLPAGTRNTMKEYFAPADMNETVNTTALPYYASREKLQHGKGWSLHMQSNPLAMVLRPQLLATLKIK